MAESTEEEGGHRGQMQTDYSNWSSSHSQMCAIAIYVALPLLLCYWVLEVHYFLRFLLCAFVAKFCKRHVRITDETAYSGICLTTDIDTLLFHMNNTRYLREVDFARADFYVRTSLWNAIKQKGGSVAQICTNIRYRRFIRPFCFYTITTKLVYWDHNSIFMEHRFVTKKSDFVNAIVMSRQRLINCSAEDVIGGLLLEGKAATGAGNGDGEANAPSGTSPSPSPSSSHRPQLPLEYVRWIESNEISSAALRNADDKSQND